MAFWDKGLTKLAREQLRAIVREEAEKEFNRLLTPTFREMVVHGVKELEELLDVVVNFEDLAERVTRLEKIVIQRSG